MESMKRLVQMRVRGEIRTRMLEKNNTTFFENILHIDQPVMESMKQSAVDAKELEKYRLMFLENGESRFFFVDGDNVFEAVEFNGNMKGSSIKFKSKKEMDAFVAEKLTSGFSPVTNDRDVNQFLRKIGRGFGILLTALGVIGIAKAVLFTLFISMTIGFAPNMIVASAIEAAAASLLVLGGGWVRVKLKKS